MNVLALDTSTEFCSVALRTADNSAAIVLEGSSKKTTVAPTNSSPTEQAGTNQVTIVR